VQGSSKEFVGSFGEFFGGFGNPVHETKLSRLFQSNIAGLVILVSAALWTEYKAGLINTILSSVDRLKSFQPLLFSN
jgi:predicted anti-sigma-YlaC factor YlaD